MEKTKTIKTKSLIALILILVFAGNVFANAIVINLDENSPYLNNYDLIVDEINKNAVIEHIAKHYGTIAINLENERVVLVFDNEKLEKIVIDNEMDAQLNLNITWQDIDYIINNYQNMNIIDKIKFLINTNMPVRDILTFGSIAISMRN